MSLHRELNRRFAAERGQLSYDMGRKLRYRMGLLLSQDPASRMVREWIYQAFEGEPRPAPAPACPVCGVGAGQHVEGCAAAAVAG